MKDRTNVIIFIVREIFLIVSIFWARLFAISMLSLSLLEDLFSDIIILSNRFEFEEELVWNEISHKGPVMVITRLWNLAAVARRL